MKRQKIAVAVACVALLAVAAGVHAVAVAWPADLNEAALTAKEVGAKLFPEKVFFRGQLAPTQLRNTGGIHFADDMYLVAGLCDSSGYSSDVRQKFQGYLVTEVAVEVGGKVLQPGAYGFGFLNGGQLVAMDVGAHDLFQTASTKDAELKRPTPMQILSPSKGTYRLYVGRDYVEVRRAH